MSTTPIDFNDVRIGDTIMERHVYKSMIHTRTGVVAAITKMRLYTDQNEVIGWSRPQWPAWKEHGLYLVHRPKPVLPTEAPATIYHVLTKLHEADYAILADDGWHFFTDSGIHFTFDPQLDPEDVILEWQDRQ